MDEGGLALFRDPVGHKKTVNKLKQPIYLTLETVHS